MSEDLTGRRLGHYRIDGVLGKGGMSVLYEATDVRLGRKVALKVIAEHITSDPEFRERFVDEARNTSAVDHANVVPLYDFGEVDGLLFIAMRLVDGADLARMLSAGALDPQRTVALLGQVADALDLLHGRGLVHLDVKPANVLVTTRESAREHVYLADFGLTRHGATGHRTRGGDFLGSPTYAAPEHLRGEPVDARTDVYSLSCVLYACLTGRPPFEGTVPEVIQGHLSPDVPPASTAGAVPDGLDEIIAKGMAKDASDRYSSCRELIDAAREALVEPGAAAATPRQPRDFRPPRFDGGPSPRPQSDPSFPPQRPGHQPMAEPVRLRPPVPARSTAFSPSSGRRWVLPLVLVLVLAAVVVTVLLVFLDGGGTGGGGADGGLGGRETSATLPNVPLDSGGEQDTDRPLPTSVPIQPR